MVRKLSHNVIQEEGVLARKKCTISIMDSAFSVYESFSENRDVEFAEY